MNRLWNRWWPAVYAFLFLTQLPFFLINVSQGSYGSASLSMASMAVIGAAWMFVGKLQARRQEKVAEYRAAIVAMRMLGSEDGEKHFLNLLAIYDGDPP